MREPQAKLTPEAVEQIAFDLAERTMTWDEPFPKFDTRYPGVLESCLGEPFQTFDGKPMFPGLIAKAAILLYLLIKNHPFQNGNKRLAVTSLLVFLAINGEWLRLSPRELYNFAVWVAESKAEHKDLIVISLEAYIERYLEHLKKT